MSPRRDQDLRSQAPTVELPCIFHPERHHHNRTRRRCSVFETFKDLFLPPGECPISSSDEVKKMVIGKTTSDKPLADTEHRGRARTWPKLPTIQPIRRNSTTQELTSNEISKLSRKKSENSKSFTLEWIERDLGNAPIRVHKRVIASGQ